MNYYWNEDTINHFREGTYGCYGILRKEIELFVTNNCSLEEGETIEELTMDLINKVLEGNI